MTLRHSAPALAGALILLPAILSSGAQTSSLPAFDRDTVLVYKTEIQDDVSQFVVRIAKFRPERFVEWENATTQGTIFMTSKAVEKARTFVNARMFEGGVDTKGKDATTLWLSEAVFKELKEKNRAKVSIDSVTGVMTVEGAEEISIDVNRMPRLLPVLKVKDDRGAERWFLDDPQNPLMVKHVLRFYTQVLTSITTDKPNTLRWIKGKKLNGPR
jgi:hypothetical protein